MSLIVFVSLGEKLDSAETPFAKTPFSWFLIKLAILQTTGFDTLLGDKEPPKCVPKWLMLQDC